MRISLIILALSIAGYFLAKAMTEFTYLFTSYHLPDLSKHFRSDSGVEIPETEMSASKYDVDAFRRRIQGMKDEDGLYDVVSGPEVTDFTGAEIITEAAEKDIDRYARSR